jgi:threonine dehydrogenase-like Zn-dependent dehydrogenase
MKAAIYYGAGDIRIEDIECPRARPEGVVLRIKTVKQVDTTSSLTL